MSDTDSDLDYASADEEASCDGVANNKNSNLSELNHPDVNNSDLVTSDKHLQEMSSISDTHTIEMSKNAENDHKNIVSKEDSITQDTESCGHLKELVSIRDSNNDELSKNTALNKSLEEKNIKHNCNNYEESKSTSLDKAVKVVKKENLNNKTVEDSLSESSASKVLEKQRVPLRLEKKIQQKQHASRENSGEKDEISTEVSPKQQDVKLSSWGFGSWGTNFLSTAASSVSTFTNQVSQGIGTVLETVESTLGAPPPEQLAVSLKDKSESSDSSLNKADEKDNINPESHEENITEVKSSILPNVMPNVSSWTKVLEDTGSKVLMGGLDTLELIGKKTIDIITEGDPGLRKKRAVFSDGITLSQTLREAKAEADESKQDDDLEKDTVHYSQMFDEYQGLVHLEALEMLSKQSEAKIQMLLMKISRNSEFRKNLEEIKSICENIPQFDDPAAYEDFEDFLTLCKKHVLELNITFNIENIIKTQKRINDVLENYENATATTSTPEEIYHSAICSLAEFTAKSIEVFHKLAELILVQPSLEPNVEHFATNLTGLTTGMCIEINKMSSRYHHCLDFISEQSENGSSQKSNITTVVTNLYLEAENSNKYIQDAFLLLVPVLQACLLESS